MAAKGETPSSSGSDSGPGNGSGPKGGASSGSSRTSFAEFGQRYALIFAWALVVLIFSLLEPDTYFTSGNFETIFGSQAVLLILALALIIPLTTGDFDL